MEGSRRRRRAHTLGSDHEKPVSTRATDKQPRLPPIGHRTQKDFHRPRAEWRRSNHARHTNPAGSLSADTCAASGLISRSPIHFEIFSYPIHGWSVEELAGVGATLP